MPHSVWSSESLKMLSVGVKEWTRFTGMQETETINVFSKIKTLRDRSVDALGLPGQRLFTLELPSFRRLVLDQPDSMYALFSVVNYSNQVDTLELGPHPGFLEHNHKSGRKRESHGPSHLLSKYNRAIFPVFTTYVTGGSTRGAAFTYNIKHVILHAEVQVESEMDENWKWEHLTSHIESLCGTGSRFSKLDQVTLYGSEWRALVGDPRMEPSLRLLHARGLLEE